MSVQDRTTWVCEVAVTDVLEACRRKMLYHIERRDWWQAEFEKAETEMRTTGIDLRSQAVTGGYRVQPVFDQEKMKRVEECQGKIEEHRRKHEDYRSYYRFLTISQQTELTVKLSPADVLYFDLGE